MLGRFFSCRGDGGTTHFKSGQVCKCVAVGWADDANVFPQRGKRPGTTYGRSGVQDGVYVQVACTGIPHCRGSIMTYNIDRDTRQANVTF